jgi:hypothetical protein
MHPIQLKIFKDMSAERKWELSIQLYYATRMLKMASIKKDHPDWDEKKVSDEVRKIFLYAST